MGEICKVEYLMNETTANFYFRFCIKKTVTRLVLEEGILVSL